MLNLFKVNNKVIDYILVSLLLTLNNCHTVLCCLPIVDFECRMVTRQKQSQEVFYKKGVPKKFTKFTGQENTCVRVSFLIKFKKETLKQTFSCQLCETFKNTYFLEHLWTTASEEETTELDSG